MSDRDLPGTGDVTGGEHAPEGFIQRDPACESEKLTPKDEPVELIYEPACGQPIVDSKFSFEVHVAVTPQLFLTRIFMYKSDGEVATERCYSANEATLLAEQIQNGEAELIEEKFGDNGSDILVDYIIASRDMARTLPLSETVGQDVVEAYKNGKITPEELMAEFEHKMGSSPHGL